MLDRRGTGLSDRLADLPSLEQRLGDVRAVMDAAGSERATLFGISEGERGRVGQVREDQREDAGDASCVRH